MRFHQTNARLPRTQLDTRVGVELFRNPNQSLLPRRGKEESRATLQNTSPPPQTRGKEHRTPLCTSHLPIHHQQHNRHNRRRETQPSPTGDNVGKKKKTLHQACLRCHPCPCIVHRLSHRQNTSRFFDRDPPRRPPDTLQTTPERDRGAYTRTTSTAALETGHTQRASTSQQT